MNASTKNATGAALQEIGKGLMQFAQFNADEIRQKNLERIRQQERGEDRALRASEREEDRSLRQQERGEDSAARKEELANASKDRAAERASDRQQEKGKVLVSMYANIPEEYGSARAQIERDRADVHKKFRDGDIGQPERDAALSTLDDQSAEIGAMIAAKQQKFLLDNPTAREWVGRGAMEPASDGKPRQAPKPARKPTAADVSGLREKLVANGTPADQLDGELNDVFSEVDPNWRALEGQKPGGPGLMEPVAPEAAEQVDAGGDAEAAAAAEQAMLGNDIKAGLGAPQGAGALPSKESREIMALRGRIQQINNSKTGLDVDTLAAIVQSRFSPDELRTFGASDALVSRVQQERTRK